MKPEMITLILNVILITFLGFGFLFGLRGIKKATSSLVSFLITIIVVLVLGPIVSNLVLNISISGTTINGYIIKAVNDMLGEEMASSSAVQDVVKNIPIIVANIVVTILLILVLGFIMKIIGAIVYRIIFGKDKVKEVEECKIVNGSPQMVKRTVKPKKHRLLGGIVGTVHGALLLFILLFPIIGLVNIFSDVAGMNEASASAEASQSFKIQTSKELLNEYVPDEAFEYVSAINDSVLCKVSKFGGIGEMSLNIVAKCELNGETIRLGEEIRTFINAYDTFVDFALSSQPNLTSMTVDQIIDDMAENPNSYKFDKLSLTVDTLFESKLIKALGNDALKLVAEKLEEQGSRTSQAKLFSHVKTAIDNYASADNSLKNDFKAFVGVLETTAKSGLLKEIRREQIDISNIKAILLNEENTAENTPKNKVLNELTSHITSSQLLQKFTLEATNMILDSSEKYINDNILSAGETPVELSYIDSSRDVRVSSLELNDIIIYGLDIYDIVNDIEATDFDNDFYVIFDNDVVNLVKLLGKELQVGLNLQIIRDTGVLDGLAYAMTKTDYNKYIDFMELKNCNNISSQFDSLSISLKEILDANIISTLRTMDDENKDASLEQVIDRLATLKESKTYANRIINPILTCTIFKNLFEYGLSEANDVLAEKLKLYDENVELSEFNTNALFTDAGNQELLNIVDNLVLFIKDINLEDLKDADNMKDSIINGNLTQLGKVLKSISDATLFTKKHNTEKGVYLDMIDVFKNSAFGEVFYFDAINETGFAWDSQLQQVSNLIDGLNTIQIDGENFVMYLMNGGDYSVILDTITSADVQKIKPMFEISIIRPIGTKVVNEINSKFKDFVGATLGANIIEISNATSLSSQAQQITDLIASALDLDFDNTDLDTINKDTINNILDKLSANSQATNGVFKESYNAFLLKTAEMINVNIKNVVGDSAGKNIVTNVALQDILDEEETIRDLLDDIMGLSSEYSSIDLKELDSRKLNRFTGSFDVETPKCKALFNPTHNALLVYTINNINSTIYDSVGAANFPDFVEYDGDINLLSRMGAIQDILTSACEAYSSLENGEGLEAIEGTDELQAMYDALESTPFTSSAKDAIVEYITSMLMP